MTHPMVINAAKAAADLPSLRGPAIGAILTTGEIEMMIQAALSPPLLNPTEDVIEVGGNVEITDNNGDTTVLFAGEAEKVFTAMITKIREGWDEHLLQR